MHDKRDKQDIGEKMSEASDQTRAAPDLEPALGENIKELPEDTVKHQVAERMSDAGKTRSKKSGAR